MRKSLILATLLSIAALLLTPSPTLPEIYPSSVSISENTLTFKGKNLDKNEFTLLGVTGPINIDKKSLSRDEVTFTTPSLLYGDYIVSATKSNLLMRHIHNLSFEIKRDIVFIATNATSTSTSKKPTNLLLLLATLLSLLHLRVSLIKYLPPFLAPILVLISLPALAVYLLLLTTLSLSKQGQKPTLPLQVKLLFSAAIVTLGAFLSISSSASAQVTPPSECIDDKDKRCIGYQISRIVKNKGLEVGLKYLNDQNLQEDVCHDVAHWTGRLTVGSLPAEKLLDGLITHCQLGYLHGVAEQLGQSAPEEDWVKFVSSCDTLPDHALRDFCGHGVGHAALMRTGADMQSAFKHCAIMKNKEALFSCRNAVPMERAIQWSNFNDQPETLIDVIKECDNLNPEDKITCVSSIWRGNLVTRPFNLVELVKLCANYPTEAASACAHGFGLGFGGDPKGLPNESKEIPCYSLNEQSLTIDCLEGYAKAASFVTYRAGITVDEVCNVITYQNCIKDVQNQYDQFRKYKDLFISNNRPTTP